MLKIDLHTHSYGSPDGSLKASHYKRMLDSKGLDIIAVTDHNTITAAQALQKKLGEPIIIGEEIDTTQGEIIGLYLHTNIAPGQDVRQAAQAIRAQGGVVYVPHPFETVRKGLSPEALDSIAELVDIIEVHNGRAIFQNKGDQALSWAKKHNVAAAAGSDAHGWRGWGSTYSYVSDAPTPKTLAKLLAAAALRLPGTVGIVGALYPKLNRLRKMRP